MNDNNFLVIPGYLRTKLNLKGSELLITALIVGYSQDGTNFFFGSVDYIASWVGIDRKNVILQLKKLVNKGILIKREELVNNVAKRCYYKFNIDCLKTKEEPVFAVENTHNEEFYNKNPELQNMPNSELQNMKNSELQSVPIYNSNKDNIEEDKEREAENKFSAVPTLFKDDDIKIKKEDKIHGTYDSKKCLFSNSRFFEFEEFEKCFKGETYETIDVFHYYNVVKDWSAAKDVKRKDWIAQTRSIIRSDISKNKLHIKQDQKDKDDNEEMARRLRYINGDY